MTADQQAAFVRSAGVEPAVLMAVIVAISAAIILFWLAWLSFSQYRLWQEGQGSFYDVIFMIISGAVIILITGVYIK